MKKVEKEFCLTDNSVNVYGYRLLTEGLELERFNPPIGYLMHERDKGVAVRWEDFRLDGDKLYAKPVINDRDFPQLAQLIEDGFYNAASVGHIVVLEWSDDEKMKIVGQSDITVTKWFPRECSIVDIPGNYNAIAQLYDENDNVLHDLSDNLSSINNHKNERNMKKLLLPLLIAAGFRDLNENSSEALFEKCVKDLVDKASKCQKIEKELSELKSKMVQDELEAILKEALDGHKINSQMADKLRKTYKENPQDLKDLLACVEPKQKVEIETVDSGSNYSDMSWDELDKSGKLAELKANDPELFTKKFNEKFK